MNGASVPAPRWWQRLWVKLAAFGVLGVITTHAIQLGVATRTARVALVARLAREGQMLAGFVARQGAEALLGGDTFALGELVEEAVRSEEIAYCFVRRGTSVMASSFGDATPTALVRLTPQREPRIVRAAGHRYLDLEMPMSAGAGAWVRIGIDLGVIELPLQRQALGFGLIAFGVMLAGALAAFVVGRRLALPLADMVSALDRMDPASEPRPLPERSSDEIGVLTQKVNQMRERLYRAHQEHEHDRRQQMQTEKLAALGTLVTGVAHEVNNPLAGLKNCLWRLKKDELAPARKGEYLEMMSEGLERIEQVVQQLLDFARTRPPRRADEPLQRLLRNVADLAEPALRARRLALRLELGSATEAMLRVDAHQIEQALLNLLLNAIYFSPEGGHVSISATRDRETVVIAIEDQGPGIDAAIADHIEDPFFTTKPEGEGTGLGLSVTRSIVQSHHGQMSFSRPDAGGTRVTLRLPLGVEVEQRGESCP